MMSTRRRTLAWAVLVGLLAGTHLQDLGAAEPARAEAAGRGECLAPEFARTMLPGEDSGLEKWSRVARRARARRTDPVRLSVHGWIRIFQRFVSPVDGESCSYYPSCSTYGLQAMEEYGLLLGVPMAAERVMRNHRPENPARYPLYEQGGDFYYWDPVRPRNDGDASGP